MKIEKFYYSSGFKKKLNKYSSKDKTKIKNKIQIFLNDPFTVKLKTHKLGGKLEGYYSFSIDYHLRILFRFENSSVVDFIDIGTHEIYK